MVLAYKMLNSANLTNKQKQIVEAIASNMNYQIMKLRNKVGEMLAEVDRILVMAGIKTSPKKLTPWTVKMKFVARSQGFIIYI